MTVASPVPVDLASGVPQNVPAASADRPRGLFSAPVLAAIVVGMMAAAFFRQGAFYPVDAFSVAVISVPVVILALWHHRDRRTLAVTVAACAFAAWWLVRSITEHSVAAFLPLGASVVGFVAAFVVVRVLGHNERRRIGSTVTAIATVSATLGLVAVLVRWTPLAAPVDGVWRVATTLTYPGAAATVFVIAVLVALGLDDDRSTARLAVCTCMAGLVATQSPWALLALGFGALFVPLRRWSVALWPIVAGLAAGLATVKAGGGAVSPWWAWPAVGVAVAMGTALRPWPRWSAGAGRGLTIAGLVLVAGLTIGFTSHAPLERNAGTAGPHDQFLNWSAAMDQWRSSKVRGVGPERVYNSRVPVSGYPGFEPDSYLTVAADGGLIGAVLLLGAGTAIAFAVRRFDVMSSCAVGALIAFVVAGNVDFDWQLPALGLLAGCVAGLAAPLARPPPEPERTPDSRRRTLRSVRTWSRPTGIVLCVLVVASEMVVGDTHIASAGIRTEDLTPPPALSSLTPARIILRGPDATDPFMLHVGTRYYLYASQGDFGSSAYDMNVPLWTGSKIGRWQAPRDVLPTLPPWAGGGATWAPDVRKVAGGWALYFSAVLKGVGPVTHCIGAAFGHDPAGPFSGEPQPMICQRDHRGSIDARTYRDADNTLVMYWKSEDNANPGTPGPDQDGRTGIWAQRLSADGRVLLGHAVEIFQPDQPWQGTIVEAPDVIQVWGTYWLFFSANWYNTAGYAIGVASCQTAFGPCTDPVPQPLLGSNAQGQGPGEPSIYNDGSNVYLLYNPWHSDDPRPTPPRPVAMARLGFRSDGPYLATP